MALFVPLGPIISWRDALNGADRYFFPSGKTTAVRGDIDWQPTLALPAPGQRYKIDNLGVSPAPVVTQPQWDYLLLAGAGLSGWSAQADVEAKLTTLLQIFSEDYTLSGQTYSGNVGYLRVENAAHTTYYDGKARILKAPYQTAPGKNVYGLVVTIQVEMLGDWIPHA